MDFMPASEQKAICKHIVKQEFRFEVSDKSASDLMTALGSFRLVREFFIGAKNSKKEFLI
jgi:hypothetical protein